ncbi:MAG: sigma-70 family RNA polymerase sigma factor [Planctomycetes bacterium]|nr:sigma-70 family RNA polymerase sigma factor [Planctomycetota bacterium]
MNKNSPSEIELLQASLRGQSPAFEAIVEKYQSLICAITYSATGSLEKSEELAQQAFIKGWKNLGQLKDLSKFRAWLCGITRNLICDSYRRQSRDITSKAIPMDSIREHPSEDEGPIEAAISKEREAIVNEALSKIPETYREPLILYYREDRSYRQVAEQLGFSAHTAIERISQARNMLREKIACLVEDTIESTKPGKVFTSMVIASIVGLTAIKGSSTAAAADITTNSTLAGSSAGATTVMSGVTAKILTAAAVAVIGVGAIITYKHFMKAEQSPGLSQTELIDQEPEELPDMIAETTTEQPGGDMATMSVVDESKDTSDNGKSDVIVPQSMPSIEPDYKFTAKGVLSGLITDADTGEPITDTQIGIYYEKKYNTKTNEHGFYTFDKIGKSDNHRININSWDHIGIDSNADRPPMIRLQNGMQVVRHFQLKKACMVELTVTDEDGKAIEDAEVHVTRLSDRRGLSVGAKEDGRNGNTTNQEGFVLLGGFPPNDRYFITVQHSYWVRVEERKNFRIHRFNSAPAGVEVFLTDPNQIQVIGMVLKKGQKVRGYVQYQDGEPADDITIAPDPEWWHADVSIPSYEVDPNGFFTFEHIVPGAYNIHALIPTGEGWSRSRILRTELPPGESEFLYVDIPMKSPKNLASISGTIEWVGEKRPGLIRIEAYSASYGRYSIQIRNFENNSFLIDRMEPGTYRLKVEGGILEPLTIENVQAPMENLVLELTCAEKPRLRGTVVDMKSQKPLSKYKVRVRKLKTLRGPNSTQSDRWFTFEGDNGKFEIEVAGPGVYEVQVNADGYVPVWSQKINTDQNSEVLISLSAGGGSIKGRVLNADGKPIESATVIPLCKASGTSNSTKNEFVSEEGAVKTNKEGEFLLTGLPSGRETVKVMHSDYTFVIEDDIEVRTGLCTDNVNVILPKGGVIEGVVYDQNGEPQGGAVIRAQNKVGSITYADDPSLLATVVSEPNGFYRIKGLPGGICYLIRKDEWSTFGVVRRTVAPEFGKTMHVDFGGRTLVSGQIIIEGTPLSNQKVIISSPHTHYSGSLKAIVKTDSEGRFVFLGIAPGRYGIFYEMNRKRSGWFRLTEFEMTSVDHDLGILPKEISILYLTIKQPINSPWDISSVYLKREKYGSSIAIPYEQGMNSNQPYKVGPVTPGRYSISVYRPDGISYNKQIDISRDTNEVIETIILPPEGDCVIYGAMADDIDSVSFQSIDESIQGYLRTNDEGLYKVTHLPAGDYRLGFYPLKKDNSINVSLMTGQPLEMNIDPSLLEISTSLAVTYVTTVSEAGSPCNVTAYLSSNGTIIEPERGTGWQKLFIAAPGQYLLHISCEGYPDLKKQITLKPFPGGERFDMKRNQILVRLKR